MPLWDSFLTDRDRLVFDKGGYGRRGQMGVRPALMVIDMQYNFLGDRPEPILDSIRRWRHSCGEEAWQAVPVVRSLLDVARARNLPIIYSGSRNEPNDIRAGNRADKNARAAESERLHEAGTVGTQIVKEIAPEPADVMLWKKRPSVFFGTPLLTHLVSLGVDTLVINGCTTSGCVRASVVDAASYGFKVMVVEEGVFDRGQASHAMALFDMQSKYADVVPVADALTYLDGVK